jgi:hypothetical protein
MRTTPICRVLAKDLEAYLRKVYRTRDCDVRAITGARGAMTPEFVVDGILGDVNNLGQQIFDIRQGYRIRNLRLALNLLCKDGFIPKGIYIIDTAVGEKPVEAYRRALNESHDPLNVECIRIKEENRRDRDFMRQAVLLDKRVLALQKEQEQNEPTPA